MLTLFEPVKVWDTVGEDKVLKGEYKILAGKMYVDFTRVSFWNQRTDHPWLLVTTSTGTEKARELSLSVKVATSQ